jgi:hypothetical protein
MRSLPTYPYHPRLICEGLWGQPPDSLSFGRCRERADYVVVWRGLHIPYCKKHFGAYWDPAREEAFRIRREDEPVATAPTERPEG